MEINNAGKQTSWIGLADREGNILIFICIPRCLSEHPALGCRFLFRRFNDSDEYTTAHDSVLPPSRSHFNYLMYKIINTAHLSIVASFQSLPSPSSSPSPALHGLGILPVRSTTSRLSLIVLPLFFQFLYILEPIYAFFHYSTFLCAQAIFTLFWHDNVF